MVENKSIKDATLIILRPNRSITWWENKLFIFAMSLPIFIIAIGWSILGAWPILPFAGIDFLLLAYCSYHICYRNYQHDWIKIDQYKITIHRGVNHRLGQKVTDLVLARCDTYLYVAKPVKPLDLPKLRLADNSQDIVIGEFLNKQDREQCCEELKKAGVVECVDKWWQQR